MKIIASCSFGKDSIAAILVALQHGIKIDELFYCRVMFDENTSAEYPEHEEFIHQVAIPKFQDVFGIKTVIIESRPYCDLFYKKYGKRSKKCGQIWGFPMLGGAWCNSMLKMKSIRQYKKSIGEHLEIVGIAADEKERIKRKTVQGKLLPLVEYGITEQMTYDICRKEGLLSPAYEKLHRQRLGCWFCHNQRVGELKSLRNNHPKFWQKLLKMQTETSVSFTHKSSLLDFEKRFSEEEANYLF